MGVAAGLSSNFWPRKGPKPFSPFGLGSIAPIGAQEMGSEPNLSLSFFVAEIMNFRNGLAPVDVAFGLAFPRAAEKPIAWRPLPGTPVQNRFGST